MITLSDDEFDELSKNIKAKGLSYQPLMEELADHYACLIEWEMSKGKDFKAALQFILPLITTENLEVIEKNTIHLLTYKTRIMKRVSWSIAAAIGLFLLSVAIFNETKFIDEPELVEAHIHSIPLTETAAAPAFVHHVDPPSRSPLDANLRITSAFGMRFHPIFKKEKMHRGIDLKASTGTPVYATADGLIEKVITHNKYGKLIVIQHDEIYQTYYAQLSAFEVKTGDQVKKGDLIGRVGSSGLSTAPHLHYEVLKNGQPVDPERYF